MKIDKNKIVKMQGKSFLVIDYLFYRGEHYLLTTELNFTNQAIGEDLSIFVEQQKDNKLFLKKVKDRDILHYICPIFEHNIKNNLI